MSNELIHVEAETVNAVPVQVSNLPTASHPAVSQRQSIAAQAEVAAVKAKIQSQYEMAMIRPRSEAAAFARIMQTCERPSFATKPRTLYSVKNRGKGPGIGLAEELAKAWGNLKVGTREIARLDDYSECEAFALDLETNTEMTRQYVTPHYRYSKDGAGNPQNTRIYDPVEIQQLIDNYGARFQRNCILKQISDDIVEAAVRKCEEMRRKANTGTPLKERIAQCVLAFAKIGITQIMIEAYLGHGVDTANNDEVNELSDIYGTIADGEATREDYFDLSATASSAAAKRTRTRTTAKTEPAKPAAQEESGAPASPQVHATTGDTTATETSTDETTGEVTEAEQPAEEPGITIQIPAEEKATVPSAKELINGGSKIKGIKF